MSTVSGRTCPLRYRYHPRTLRDCPETASQTLYVIGGLYGNLPALRAIEAVSPFAESHHARARLLAHATMIRDELEKHFHGEDCAELRGRFECIDRALAAPLSKQPAAGSAPAGEK